MMKDANIINLPIVPEDYEIDHYAQIDYSGLHSEMTESERRFVNGLIRWYEPGNVLEIGVARGGGTVNILHAMSDMNSNLVSIDRAESWWGDNAYAVGEDVAKSGVNAENWQLLMGVDPSEVLDELNIMFDFLILDSAHLHPVESLNFLCALPYLNDGAIVILHDTTDYLKFSAERFFANRILMMTVCADKIEPVSVSATGYPNIVAFQVRHDTRKYVRNIFDSLMLPWEIVTDDVEKVGEFISKHYSAELLAYYQKAVGLQKRIPFIRQIGGLLLKVLPDVIEFDNWHRLGGDLIFYGAGNNMRYLLETGQELGWRFEYAIWDIDAERIGEICGCPVSAPDFETPAKPGHRVVITIVDYQLSLQVRNRLERLGYRVFHGLRELVEDIRNPLKAAP